mmetsp:Transcript_20945/g.36049  ORF Transcript_20945/g.36049 Transcript_20945/m.36049 type:complete len:81 (-) Transcript_20945:123-365(-)
MPWRRLAPQRVADAASTPSTPTIHRKCRTRTPAKSTRADAPPRISRYAGRRADIVATASAAAEMEIHFHSPHDAITDGPS